MCSYKHTHNSAVHIQAGDGPSQIVKAINDAGITPVDVVLDWKSVVDNPANAKYFKHITENRYDINNPQYKNLNLNVGDYIDLVGSFALAYQWPDYTPLAPSWGTSKIDEKYPAVYNQGGSLSGGMSAGLGWGFIQMDIWIPEDSPYWEAGKRVTANSRSSSLAFKGAGIFAGDIKLTINKDIGLSLSNTLKYSKTTTVSYGSGFIFGYNKINVVEFDGLYNIDMSQVGFTTPYVSGSVSGYELDFSNEVKTDSPIDSMTRAKKLFMSYGKAGFWLYKNGVDTNSLDTKP